MKACVPSALPVLALALWACGASPPVSPTKLPAIEPEITQIVVLRYGSSCEFTISEPEEISRVVAFFNGLLPRTANEYRSFDLIVYRGGETPSRFTLGDDWVGIPQTGHTYHTSAWRFREPGLIRLLTDESDRKCR
jgi:hypothetical protein